MILGRGKEGIVYLRDGLVEKEFYPGVLDDEQVAWFRQALRGTMPSIPEPNWERADGRWRCRYPWFESEPVEEIGLVEASEFLHSCLRAGLVCANIKRSNFRRRTEGGLTFIDVGDWLVPMRVRYFIDAAARLYCIAALNWSDEKIQRDAGSLRKPGALEALTGFADFYREMMTTYAQSRWSTVDLPELPAQQPHRDELSLLIKACAMDAAVLQPQVHHIIQQLERPRQFRHRFLLLDPFRGPFLRQFDPGDFDRLSREAAALKVAGVIDEVWVAPDDPETVAAIHNRWFDLSCPQTHTAKGVPVAPQLWAFDRIPTRYVLQCDVDVLIGRRDLDHDYQTDMLKAVQPDDVLGVAFNIPHPPDAAARPYDAPPGQYVPEVPCGLLDLHRVRACRPLPNRRNGEKLELSWYRSLEQHQQQHDLRTLRGGDPRTWYIHPPNEWKQDPSFLGRIRDLVGQDRIPALQHDQWDLVGTAADWDYERRSEEIVFLVKGRNTPLQRTRRCMASLVMQDDPDFGVVLIDDASDHGTARLIPPVLGPLRDRTTLIRHASRQGRIPNFRLAIREICTDPDTLVVILDLDDALMAPNVVRRLKLLHEAGHDVVLASMFRPDKPTKQYEVNFSEPRANRSGGNVWIHLRAFRKRLFDQLTDEDLQIGGEWIPECTDYATMIPMVELCRNPIHVEEYWYFHERTTPRTPDRRRRKDAIIDAILAKPPKRAPTSSVEP